MTKCQAVQGNQEVLERGGKGIDGEASFLSGEEVESSVAPEVSDEVTSLIPVCCARKCLKLL